MRNILTRYHII